MREVRTIDKEFLTLEDKTEKIILKYERLMKKGYKNALDEMRKEIAKLYESYSDSEGKLTLEEMNKYNRMDNLKKVITTTLGALYIAHRRETNKALKEIYTLNTNEAVSIIKKPLGEFANIRLNFDGILKKLDVDKVINEEMAGLNWAERLGKHRADVIYNVEKTVREGLYNGDTYKTMATRLKDSLEGDVINPTRIVRTESGRVMQQASLDVMDQVSQQVKVWKRWKTSGDERVRSSHRILNDTEIPYDELFTFSDGTQTPAPRISGSPQNIINCRCILSYRFE
ncbi:MAG: phage head morphogenesis protein [Chitinophagales bacterium]|nr:phage head morphogenesis protein [Chitinophagales bacterium]